MSRKSVQKAKLRRVKKKKKVRREGSPKRRTSLRVGVRMLLVAIAVVAAMGIALWLYFALISAQDAGRAPAPEPAARPFPNDRVWPEPG